MGLDLGIACGVRESWLGIHPIAWVFSSQWWVGDLLDRPAALTGSVGFQPPQFCQQPKDVAACFEAENNQLTSPHTFHFNYTCSSYSVLKNKKNIAVFPFLMKGIVSWSEVGVCVQTCCQVKKSWIWVNYEWLNMDPHTHQWIVSICNSISYGIFLSPKLLTCSWHKQSICGPKLIS